MSVGTQKQMEASQFMSMLKFFPLKFKTYTETLEKLLIIPSSSSFRVREQVFLMSFVSIYLEIAFSILD